MKIKMNKKVGVAASLLLSSTLLAGGIVKADDDHEHEDYKYKEHGEEYEYYEGQPNYYGEEYEDDDHDYEEEGGEYGGYSNYTTVTPTIDSNWNVWSKSISTNKGDLPFTDAKKVTMTIANSTDTTNLYVIPKDGEIFVPGKTVAEFLGANATYYKTSNILDIKKDNGSLTFRANTNVAYENDIKSALPSQVFYLNNELYVPISAIANGLGYTVDWQNNTFVYTNL